MRRQFCYLRPNTKHLPLAPLTAEKLTAFEYFDTKDFKNTFDDRWKSQCAQGAQALAP